MQRRDDGNTVPASRRRPGVPALFSETLVRSSLRYGFLVYAGEGLRALSLYPSPDPNDPTLSVNNSVRESPV